MNFLQNISVVINPTKISQDPYNMCKQTLYDFKMKRSANVWNKNKQIIINYFQAMLAEEDLKACFDYIIVKPFCAMFGADYQNIMHYKKGRVQALSKQNSIILQDFFSAVADFLEEQEEEEKPDFQYNDKVKVRYHSDQFNYVTFLNADPILNHKKEWVAPIFIYDVGVVYIPCNDMKLLRKLSS